MAAALGNAGNRRSFSKGFFRDESAKLTGADVPGDEPFAENASDVPHSPDAQPPSMKQLLEAATKDYQRYQSEWQAAKKTFKTLLADFEARRAVLLLAEKAALRFDDCHRRLQVQHSAVKTLTEEIGQASQNSASQHDALAIQRLLVESRQATLVQLRAANLPSLWDRVVALFGLETARMGTLRQVLASPTADLAQASEALAAMAREVASADVRLNAQRERHRTLCNELQVTEREQQGYQRAIKDGHDTGAKHFPDARLWALPIAELHRASVAVSPALDGLRARIFLQAMELHRLTVLATAGKFIANLRAVNGMLTGGLKDKLLPEQRPMLWDAFFFVVPVVSTTLASFDRLFSGMGQESLGWLLVDEAGQATPQSTAGALWRSQRAVLIGDPLQIEPVFTVPLGLVEELRKRQDVASIWRIRADASRPHYTLRLMGQSGKC
jgi:hypothetical protein